MDLPGVFERRASFLMVACPDRFATFSGPSCGPLSRTAGLFSHMEHRVQVAFGNSNTKVSGAIRGQS